MSKDQIANMKTEYISGIKPKALMEKYNISKHALYHHVDKSDVDKSNVIAEKIPKVKTIEQVKTIIKTPELISPNIKIDNTGIEDPLIDFEQMNKPQKINKISEQDFNMNLFEDDNDDMDLFNPSNLLKEVKAPKQDKFSIKSFFSKTKEPKVLSPEEEMKQTEEEQLKLVYQVRMYLYTFRDIENLFSALNLDNEDKKINKYIQDLYKKKKPELIKLLDFIKFNVRHSNNTIVSNFYSSIFFTITKVLETIITRIGVDLTGLTDELKNDKEIIMNLKEIEIEMIGNKLNLGPKVDILLKICTKSLTKYTENTIINSMKNLNKNDVTKDISAKLNCKPKNDILEEKYMEL